MNFLMDFIIGSTFALFALPLMDGVLNMIYELTCADKDV